MTILDVSKEQLNGSLDYLNSIPSIAASYLIPNSLEDETYEFFREVAALKGKSVEETLIEMMAGSQRYLQAISIKIEFENDYPKDINLYADKLQKISEGIESCWDIFSNDTRQFFKKLAYDFVLETTNKFEGLKGLQLRLKLLLPSLNQKENLFNKYRKASLLIPKAVDRAVALRESKSTSILESSAQILLKKVQEIQTLEKGQKKFFPNLKHFGKTPEEQLEKNQGAIKWARARIEEIENKYNGKKV